MRICDGDAGQGLHATIADEAGSHHLWLPDGALPSRAAVVIPLDEFFFWRIRSASRLKRLIERKHSGPLPPEQRLSRFQLHRAALMLRAWDGVASGASRQAIASILLNRDVQTLRAIDWKNAPERRRLARILGDARKRIKGGYLHLLAPVKSRRRIARRRG